MLSRIPLRLALATFVLVVQATGVGQELVPTDGMQKEEVQAILHEASTLIPKIDPRQQSSAVANIAGQQTRAGDLAGALTTAQIPTKQYEKDMAIASIAYALTSEGDSSTAFDLVGLASEHKYNLIAYQQMATFLARKHDFAGALKAARLIDKDPKQRATLIQVLMWIYRMQCDADDRQGAAETFKEALEVSNREQENKNSAVPRSTIAVMYRESVDGLDRSGNREEIPTLLDHIQMMTEAEQNPSEKQALIRELAVAQNDSGQYSAAFETAKKLSSLAERDAILDVIITTQAAKGDPYSALREVDDISSKFLHLVALREIADAMAASGNYTEALTTIDSIPGAGDRAYALAQLGLEQAKKDDHNAEHTLDLAWQTASSAKTETKPYVFEFVVVGRGFLGDFSEAIDGINDLNDESRVWPLWNLTASMVSAGKKDEALALAESQHAPHARAYALLGVASELNRQIDAAKKPGQ